MSGDYIKVHRCILEWEWWEDINTTRLFLYMLLKANWKEGKFKGINVPRGSFISSINKLSLETKLTEREVRTAISHLKKTGEVTSRSSNKFTVFTVVNYSSYQSDDKQTDKELTGNRHSNVILTSTIEEKKEREEEKNKKKNTKRIFFPDDGMLSRAFDDFIDMRKKMKAPMTERALDMTVTRLEKLAGNDHDLAIRILEQSIMNSWKSLYPLKNQEQKSAVSSNKFNNFKQRNYDYDKLEQELLSSNPANN